MENIINLKIKKHKLDGEIYYVATSDEVQGLVAEGKSIQEVTDIARDVAKAILESKSKKETKKILHAIPRSLNFPLIVSA